MELIFLGDFIRCRREDLGLTQRQLCEGICEPMTISRIERGNRRPVITPSLPCWSAWVRPMTGTSPC